MLDWVVSTHPNFIASPWVRYKGANCTEYFPLVNNKELNCYLHSLYLSHKKPNCTYSDFPSKEVAFPFSKLEEAQWSCFQCAVKISTVESLLFHRNIRSLTVLSLLSRLVSIYWKAAPAWRPWWRRSRPGLQKLRMILRSQSSFSPGAKIHFFLFLRRHWHCCRIS